MSTERNNLESDAAVAESSMCELLPWHLNGTLTVAQARAMDVHIGTCVACQEAREVWRAVHHQCLNDKVGIGDVEAGLAAMNQQLDRFLADNPRTDSDRTPRATHITPWLRQIFQPMHLSAGLAIVLVAWLGVSNLYQTPSQNPSTPSAVYATLSDSRDVAQPPLPVAGVQQQQFRILFHRDTTDARMQAIFNQFKAQVVAGPTAKGVYTVSVPAQEMAPRQIAETLRGEPEILVAEWISDL